MKKRYLFILFIPLSWFVMEALNFSTSWMTDFETAKAEAKKSNKNILLYFSGSDWCGNCMKWKKDILESESFKSYASDNLILMLADFPRMKKNKLDEKTTYQNEALAEQYNKRGGFPFTVLMNADGKVLKEWNGYADIKPDVFVDQINKCKKSQ